MNSPKSNKMRWRRGRELIARQAAKSSTLRPNAPPALARAAEGAKEMHQRADAARRGVGFDLAVTMGHIAAALAQPDETADSATREMNQRIRSAVDGAVEMNRLHATVLHLVVHSISDLWDRDDRLEQQVAEMSATIERQAEMIAWLLSEHG